MSYLKKLRKEKEMTQKELAVKTGLLQPTISRLENGLQPTSKQMEKILKVLNVDSKK